MVSEKIVIPGFHGYKPDWFLSSGGPCHLYSYLRSGRFLGFIPWALVLRLSLSSPHPLHNSPHDLFFINGEVEIVARGRGQSLTVIDVMHSCHTLNA